MQGVSNVVLEEARGEPSREWTDCLGSLVFEVQHDLQDFFR
jgi:hypothetical protein